MMQDPFSCNDVTVTDYIIRKKLYLNISLTVISLKHWKQQTQNMSHCHRGLHLKLLMGTLGGTDKLSSQSPFNLHFKQ